MVIKIQNVAFKNCALFTRFVTHINDKHIDTAESLDITMPMYNLIEYSANNSDTSASLWQFKKDERPVTNSGNPDNVSTINSTSFKYKSSILGKSADDGVLINVKIVLPLKYISNFWRSLEVPLINCKIPLGLNWTKNCVMSDIAGNTKFKIINTTLYVPIITLSTKDNVKLTNQLGERFKKSVYWNQYKAEITSRNLDDSNPLRSLLHAIFQGVKRLFVLVFDSTYGDPNSCKKQSKKLFSPKNK